MTDIQKRIEAIEQRNTKVELDKAWEVSIARKVIIALLTYITIFIFFLVSGLPDPLANSFVTAIAFLLSTLSLPYFKILWLHFQKK